MISSLSTEVIVKSESFPEIRAGIARLEDILKAPSYKAVPDEERFITLSDEGTVTEWPLDAGSVLVLGLHHPEDRPQLDLWDGGNTPGNRRLMEISDYLKQWLREKHKISAHPLPYHVERGGLFLKDAAVLAGLGIIGRNNLLLNPDWGPRIRLRSVLIEEELEPSRPVEGFSPCDTCGDICHKACPQNAFSTGLYYRPNCITQIYSERTSRKPDGETSKEGIPGTAIRYCRVCEFACPVGA